VIQQARKIIDPDIPIHLYGGGDPLELPFYIFMGCDIFDSSSFIHYARGGWYMTPYGAFDVQRNTPASLPWTCECPLCKTDCKEVWENEKKLALHNLWTIQDVIREMRMIGRGNGLSEYLNHVTAVHQECFPESRLAGSWERLCNNNKDFT